MANNFNYVKDNDSAQFIGTCGTSRIVPGVIIIMSEALTGRKYIIN